MLCRSVVMVQLGIQERERHAEEISRLDHQLAKASGQLQQSLVANSDLSKRWPRRRKRRREVAEAERLLGEVKVEMARVATENTHLNKMVEEMDEKLSSSATELATLKAAKDEAKDELDRNFEQTEELLRQSFLFVVRQAHVLYGGSSASGAFDLDHEVYQVQIMPIVEMKALASQQVGPTEGNENEGNQD